MSRNVVSFLGGNEKCGREVALLALLAVLQARTRPHQAVGPRQTLQGLQGQGEGKRKGKTKRAKVL